jgi:hypothetical protein
MALKRPCLDCGKLGRWRHRCPRCQAEVDRRKVHARPDLHDDAAERRRRARAVADHRATVGDWCPGLADHPAHPRPTWSPTTSSRSPPEGRKRGRCACCAGPRTAGDRPEF